MAKYKLHKLYIGTVVSSPLTITELDKAEKSFKRIGFPVKPILFSRDGYYYMVLTKNITKRIYPFKPKVRK